MGARETSTTSEKAMSEQRSERVLFKLAGREKNEKNEKKDAAESGIALACSLLGIASFCRPYCSSALLLILATGFRRRSLLQGDAPCNSANSRGHVACPDCELDTRLRYMYCYLTVTVLWGGLPLARSPLLQYNAFSTLPYCRNGRCLHVSPEQAVFDE